MATIICGRAGFDRLLTKHAPSFCIDEPDDSVTIRCDDLCGGPDGIAWPLQHARDRAGFVGACNDECNIRRTVDNDGRHSDPPHATFFDILGAYPSCRFKQVRTGEQGGNVRVGPHSEMHEVEPIADNLVNEAFISRCSSSWPVLSANAMHVVRRNRHMVEQRGAHHSEVARFVRGRHASFVSPKDMDARPVNTRGICGRTDHLVRVTRRTATRERDCEAPMISNTVIGKLNEIVRSSARKVF